MRYLSILSLMWLCLCGNATGQVTVLDFDSPIPGTLADSNGLGTGFTHRLPGTGSLITENDGNLSLHETEGYLSFTSQRSDINHSNEFGRNLGELDAPALLLTDAAGKNFRITARFNDVEVTQSSDQLVLFVGTSADKVVRGGFHDNHLSPTLDQFVLAGNTGSGDFGFPQIDQLGVFELRDDVVLALSRTNGDWLLKWQNLTDPADNGAKGFAVPWLDLEPNLYVGVMHLDARNFAQQTSQIDYFRVAFGEFVPEPNCVAFIASMSIGLLMFRRGR